MTKMVDYESMIDLSQIKNLLKVFLIFLFSSLVILVSFQKRILYSRRILSPDKFYHKITVNIVHEYVIYVLERLATQKCGTQSFARRDTSDEQFVAFHTGKTLLISAMMVHSGRTWIIWLFRIICFLLH